MPQTGPLGGRFTALPKKSRCLSRIATRANATTRHQRADVVVVGSGIIALSIAHDLLERTNLSVAVIERANGLCAGATGAGQGYLWQLHRDPLNIEAWRMAEKGRARWKQLAEEDPTFSVDTNGSMLLATTLGELDEIKSRVNAVNGALSSAETSRAVFLPTREHVVLEEPALVESDAPIFGGAMLPSDSQIDGREMTNSMFKKCAHFGSERFQPHFGVEVERLLIEGGAAKGVSCAGGLKVAAGAVCVAAGAWSSTLLSSWLGSDDWTNMIVPRRGHLLVVRPGQQRTGQQRFLIHGIMESSYSKHYTSVSGDEERGSDRSDPRDPQTQYDVTFTATETSADGTLLIGSSRELASGFDQAVNPRAVKDIMDAARAYLPSLLDERCEVLQCRVGLRPWARDGPIVGPVEGVENLFIAAGHEGSGLTLAPATAELMRGWIDGGSFRNF
jgi:glycine/D-amino acid oxidase-like deaminating enzyme